MRREFALTGIAVDTRQDDDVVVIAVAGEVDIATVPKLQQAISEVLAAPPARVEVDLAGVSFLDSTGIGALVAGRNRAAEIGVRFVVANPRSIVRRVLDVSGLLGPLGVDDTSV